MPNLIKDTTTTIAGAQQQLSLSLIQFQKHADIDGITKEQMLRLFEIGAMFGAKNGDYAKALDVNAGQVSLWTDGRISDETLWKIGPIIVKITLRAVQGEFPHSRKRRNNVPR